MSMAGGTFAPATTRLRTDTIGNDPLDRDLGDPFTRIAATTRTIDTCRQRGELPFSSNQLVTMTNGDPGVLSGCGVRAPDWSYGVSVQQQPFRRASVDVGRPGRPIVAAGPIAIMNPRVARLSVESAW
jgi:hypothetical protein